MFIDPDQWSDEELFKRVGIAQDVRDFMLTNLGKRMLDKAKEKHLLAMQAMTDFSIGVYNLEREEDRKVVERILRDLAEPTRVLRAFSDLIIDGERAEAIAQQRDMEDNS